MNRRQFNHSLLGTMGAWLLEPSVSLAQPRSSLRVNGPRVLGHIERLSEYGRNPERGVSRVAYSEADLQGRQFVIGLMRAASLEVKIDLAGNLIGQRPGTDPNLPPLAFGSHIDSVPNGGNYDGPLGSLGAVEIAQTLAENKIASRHPLELIVFQNEEGGKTGSRALIGEVTATELDRVTHSGKTIREGIELIGGDPEKLDDAKRKSGDIAGFLELHIEQGGVLETKKIDIGVVQGIVGIKRWNVILSGVANHAGTTPMEGRQDALLSASRFISAVNEVVTQMPGRQVGTVGRIQAHPGAPNVIPGRVELSLEIRDLDMAKIDRVFEAIESEGRSIAREAGTAIDFDPFYVSHAAPTDERFRDVIEKEAKKLELTSLRMPSGAGHDAQSMAKLGPVGMIFIPSLGGISHSPREFSSPEDIVQGINVFLQTLLTLDGMLS
jgi:N-carbamoyl-L-amino-acid hydrolase